MIALTIFASTFILVFALGFQSLNVNNGHYKAAFWTSFAISISNLVLFKTLPQADPVQIAAYLSGGPFGIVTAMWAHRRTMKKPQPEGNVDKPAPWPAPPEGRLMSDEESAAHIQALAENSPLLPHLRGDLLPILKSAESFIAGFEDDNSQKGVGALLEQLREKIAEIESTPSTWPGGWMILDGRLERVK